VEKIATSDETSALVSHVDIFLYGNSVFFPLESAYPIITEAPIGVRKKPVAI